MSPIDLSGVKIDLTHSIKPIKETLKCAISAIEGSSHAIAPKIRRLIALNCPKQFKEDVYPKEDTTPDLFIRRTPSPAGSSPLSKA